MGKNSQPDREGGIKIIDPKRIDYYLYKWG